MLDKIGKIAPYLAAAVLAYLAYTVVEAGALTPPQGKEGPGLTRRMLHPDLVVPKDHASPAGRDPFEVAWARYLNKMGADNPPPPKGPADEADEEWEAYLGETPVAPAKAAAGGAPSPPAETPKAGPPKDAGSKAAATPAPPATPPAPPALGGVMVSEGSRLAVLDGRVYQEGESLRGADPGHAWLVETIEADRVVLRLGDVQQTLKLRE